jgi:hypothetical protein
MRESVSTMPTIDFETRTQFVTDVPDASLASHFLNGIWKFPEAQPVHEIILLPRPSLHLYGNGRGLLIESPSRCEVPDFMSTRTSPAQIFRKHLARAAAVRMRRRSAVRRDLSCHPPSHRIRLAIAPHGAHPLMPRPRRELSRH